MRKPPPELATITWLSDRPKIYANWAGAERIRTDVLSIENRYRKWQHLYEDDPKASMRALRLAVSNSRARLAQFVGCPDPVHLLFSTGSEGALKEVLFAHQILPWGSRILATDCEFYGVYSKIAPPRYHADVAPIAGKTKAQEIVNELVSRLRPDTKLVLVSHVCYNTGVELPIAEICRQVKAAQPQVLVLVDGAQAVGHIPVDVTALGCDFYAADAHKWLAGPDQTGFLYVRSDPHLEIIARDASSPFAVHPSLNHDKGSRSGVVAISLAALGDSLEPFMDKEVFSRAHAYALELAEKFRSRCTRGLSDFLRVYPHPECDGRTAIVSLVLQQTGAGRQTLERLHEDLLAEGIHCALIGHTPVAYADQIKTPPMLRFSFSVWNTEADVEAIVQKLGLLARRSLMAASVRA